jgi:hypothetical protein
MTEAQKPLPSDTVSVRKRLLCWFGIYLGFQLPLIMMFPFFFNYPWGLDPYLAFTSGPDKPPFRVFGYFVYLIHLALTMALPDKRAFRVLMIVLIIIVSLNTASCVHMLGAQAFKPFPEIRG